MTATDCAGCEPLISPWLDGELPPEQAAAVVAHLHGCARCGAIRDEYTRMIAGARELPGVAASPPRAAAMWSRIDAALDEAERPRGLRALAGMLRGRLRYLVPAALAAALALGVGGRAALRRAPSDEVLRDEAQSEFRQAEAHYLKAIADLRRLAELDRGRWPETERTHFDVALATMERGAEDSRRFARGAPIDPEAQDRLYSAYRAEIAFLEDALLRGGVHP